MGDKFIVSDTTLCDGEQSPGVPMIKDEEIHIAKQLEGLKVDVVETGFTASSDGDFEAIRMIALLVKGSRICSFVHTNDRDISRIAETSKPAGQLCIHTFITISALHMEKKLRVSPDQVYEQTYLAVRFVRQFTDDTESSPGDGSRSDTDSLCCVLEGAITEGATTINLPDTVGYAVPEGHVALIRSVRERAPNSDEATWSVHCYSGLGMVVANSLTIVRLDGVRQIECAISGPGERAGNTNLEEVTMAVKTRHDYFNLDMGVGTTQIVSASELALQITGFVMQPSKAVMGASIFTHASGIHQDSVLKVRSTYEIIRIEGVSWVINEVVLDKFLGCNVFKRRLQELGIELGSEVEPSAAFTHFEELADQKAKIFGENIIAIVSNEAQHSEGKHFRFVSLVQHSETGERPHARIIFVVDGKEVTGETEDDGPVDATLNAIESKVASGAKQLLYSVNAITTGTQAQDEATVRLLKSGRIVNGVGTDPDTVAAPAKARFATLNKLQDKSSERLNSQT